MLCFLTKTVFIKFVCKTNTCRSLGEDGRIGNILCSPRSPQKAGRQMKSGEGNPIFCVTSRYQQFWIKTYEECSLMHKSKSISHWNPSHMGHMSILGPLSLGTKREKRGQTALRGLVYATSLGGRQDGLQDGMWTEKRWRRAGKNRWVNATSPQKATHLPS